MVNRFTLFACLSKKKLSTKKDYFMDSLFYVVSI